MSKVRLAQLIGNILNQENAKSEDIETLKNIPHSWLNKLEIAALNEIFEHFKQYGCLPSPDAYKKLMGKVSVYDDVFKADEFPYLYELFVKTTANEFQIETMQKMLDKVALGETLSKEYVVNEFSKTPEIKKEDTVKDLAEEDNDYLFDGVDENDGFYLGTPLDSEIGLVRAGKVIGFIFPPSTGKTTLSAILAAKIYSQGKKILFLCFEQTADEIKQKIYGALGEFNTKLFNAKKNTPLHTKLLLGKEKASSRITTYKENGGLLKIRKASGWTPDKVREFLTKDYRTNGIKYDLVIADNFYIMSSSIDETKTVESWHGRERNVESLRQICMGEEDIDGNIVDDKYPFALILTSQLKAGSSGADESDVKKTQSIVETADVLITMVAPHKELHRIDEREMRLIKARGGAKIFEPVPCKFDFETTSFWFGTQHTGVYPIPYFDFNQTSLQLLSVKIRNDVPELIGAGMKRAMIMQNNPDFFDDFYNRAVVPYQYGEIEIDEVNAIREEIMSKVTY